MVVYRLITREFSENLNGAGAKKYGGRWNPIDYAMLYASTHISLSALEVLVHNESKYFLPEFVLMHIKLPETNVKVLKASALKKNWMHDIDYTKDIGRDFLNSNLLIMQVPSIVITQEYNVLINPNHPLFGRVKILETELFKWDKRLSK
jgi:RES domain-containing protein